MSGREGQRRSTRRSLIKEVDLAALSEAFNIPLGSESGSESSDQEYAPHDGNDSNATSSDASSGGSDAGESEEEGEEEGEEEEGKEKEEEEEGGREPQGEENRDDIMEDTDPLTPLTTATAASTSPPPPTIIQPFVGDSSPLCCVCLEQTKHNDIVTCDMCGLSVHEGCYGVPEEDESSDTHSNVSSFTTAPWFCDACKAGVKAPCCELCPNEGGIFKQTVAGRWVHMVCSLYTSGVEYMEPKTLSGVSLDKLPAGRWGARPCQLCGDDWLSRTGVCINCDAGLCRTYFHATCAQREGLLCEADDNSEDSKEEIADPYFAYCHAHCDKLLARRKKKDFLNVHNAQKKFKYDDTDERMLGHLQQSRVGYKSFFKKLQRQYQPLESNQKRLLHHCPSAFKWLTQKAQLLGFIAMPSLPKVKRHGGRVCISLTCDFVNYFHERTGILEQLKKKDSNLTTTKSALVQQQQDLNKEQQQVEQELNALQSEHEQMMKEHAVLSSALLDVTGEELTLPGTHLPNHTDTNLASENDQRCCCVCSTSTSTHLMVSCDTCSNIYHIFCLDPPLSRVPKKTRKYGWQCEECCCDSEEDMKPAVAQDEPHSRSGRPLRSHKRLYLNEMSVTGTKRKRRKRA